MITFFMRDWSICTITAGEIYHIIDKPRKFNAISYIEEFILNIS
jgi:hypothetical protein